MICSFPKFKKSKPHSALTSSCAGYGQHEKLAICSYGTSLFLFSAMKMQGFLFIIISTCILPLPKKVWVWVLRSLKFVLKGQQKWAGQALQSGQLHWAKLSSGTTLLARVQQGNICIGEAGMEMAHTRKNIQKTAKTVCSGIPAATAPRTGKIRVSNVTMQAFVLSWRTEPYQIMCCVYTQIYLKNPLHASSLFQL